MVGHVRTDTRSGHTCEYQEHGLCRPAEREEEMRP